MGKGGDVLLREKYFHSRKYRTRLRKSGLSSIYLLPPSKDESYFSVTIKECYSEMISQKIEIKIELAMRSRT